MRLIKNFPIALGRCRSSQDLRNTLSTAVCNLCKTQLTRGCSSTYRTKGQGPRVEDCVCLVPSNVVLSTSLQFSQPQFPNLYNGKAQMV